MKILEYQAFTPTTAIYPKDYAMAYLSTGIAAEAGEVAGAYAKFFRGDYTREQLLKILKKELGDVLWFISQICNEEGLSIEEDVIHTNVNKLTSRSERGVLKGSGDDR